MCQELYNIMDLILSFLGLVVAFGIGFQANLISKSIEKHNNEMEKIARRPYPIVDAIYPSKSTGKEDYENHMRFYFGDMDVQELKLDEQIYVKKLNSELMEDNAIIDECLKNKNRVYLTYIHGNCCFVYNNIKDDKKFLFEYCSTRIELKNYKGSIVTIKVNYLIVRDNEDKETKIEGIEDQNERCIPISENGYIEILMCFAANNPEDTLCINDSEKYSFLPTAKINVLKNVVNKPILKYKKLTFNFTFGTVEKDKEPFTYELIIDVMDNGLKTRTNYISDR